MRRLHIRLHWQPGQPPSMSISPQRQSASARLLLHSLGLYLLHYLSGQPPEEMDLRLSVELAPDGTAQVTLPPGLDWPRLLCLLYVAAALAASPHSQPQTPDRRQE